MIRMICSLVCCVLGVFVSLAWSGSYQYLPAEQVKQAIEENAPLVLVDIQPPGDFRRHHLPGALETSAYPVKTAADQQRLASVLPRLRAGQEAVVIICPRGKGGAERTYAYLQASGISAERLFILENGQKGWPYPDLVVGE